MPLKVIQSQFECSRFHSKCHAMCCQNVPIEKAIYLRNKYKLVVWPDQEIEFEGIDAITNEKVDLVLPLTLSGYCPFLDENLRCAIYNDKPKVCNAYGNEEIKCMRCPYQDKNGRVRTRQEKRKILRDSAKETERLLKLNAKEKEV